MSCRAVARLCRRGRAWGLLAGVVTQLCSQSPLCSGHGVHAVNVCAADERPVSRRLEELEMFVLTKVNGGLTPPQRVAALEEATADY